MESHPLHLPRAFAASVLDSDPFADAEAFAFSGLTERDCIPPHLRRVLARNRRANRRARNEMERSERSN